MSNTNMELFKNNNGKICLHIKTVNGANYVVVDKNLKRYVNSITTFKIKGVRVINNSDIELIYDNFNLVIRSCDKLLTNEVLLPMNNSINNFIEQKTVKELPHKKVTRNSKHTGVIVAAGSIALACLLTILPKIAHLGYIDVKGENEIVESNTIKSPNKKDYHLLVSIDDEPSTSLSTNYDKKTSILTLP